MQITEAKFPIGTRVLVQGRHPHAGKMGTVVRYETAGLLGERGAIVLFDDGASGFVFKTQHIKAIGSGK